MQKKNIQIPVSEVVLLEDRAHITRIGEVTLPAGQYNLLLADVSPVIYDKTLSVKAGNIGEIRVVDARVKRSVRDRNEMDTDRFTDIDHKIKDLQKQRKALLDKQSISASGVETAGQVLDLLFQEIPVDVAWGKMIPDNEIKVIDEIEDSIETSSLQLFDIGKELKDLTLEIDDLTAVADTLQTPSTRYGADIIIKIDVMNECTFNLTVDYLVPEVCWRPRYRAELLDGTLNFYMEGSVWQNTGEDWKDIQLLFSTQRISPGIEPPVLVEDSIYIQKKPKEEIVEIREQQIQETGLGSSPDDSSGDMPGIDDCGAVQKLRASGRSSIPSDGFPYRIGISAFKTGPEIDLAAIPELSNYVFIRSRHKNDMGTPILAGSVDLIRNSGLSGRTSVLFIAPGEDFELTWGPDPDLRVNRVENIIDEKSGPVSSWTQKRYRITIRLSNLGREDKKILIKERIPVSEVEKVQVVFDKDKTSSGFTIPDENGIVTWKRELSPLGRDVVTLEYTVRKHKAVVEVGSTAR